MLKKMGSKWFSPSSQATQVVKAQAGGRPELWVSGTWALNHYVMCDYDARRPGYQQSFLSGKLIPSDGLQSVLLPEADMAVFRAALINRNTKQAVHTVSYFPVVTWEKK